MGIFKDMMSSIFHHGAVAEHPPDAAAAPTASSSPAATATAVEVDVEATLDRLAAANKPKLDWRHSIVDMMKLLGMDSGLTARKALAADLRYTGDTSDTAKMNVWLHQEVMKKLAENGGKVPPELLGR